MHKYFLHSQDRASDACTYYFLRPYSLLFLYEVGMGNIDILIYDYCKAKISRLSQLLLQLQKHL